MCSCRVIYLVSMHNMKSREYSSRAKKGSLEIESDMLLYFISAVAPSFTPSRFQSDAAAVASHTYIEDLCIGKLLVALVPAADKSSGRVHRVARR